MGAANGALAATGVGLIGQVAGGAVLSAANNVANQVIDNNGFDNFDVGSMAMDAVIGGVCNGIAPF